MIRKAKITDCKQIHLLVNSWAKKGKVLERSLNDIYENIRDFWVCTQKNKIVACCAFHVVGWQDLGEIKSLVVAKDYQKKGIGVKLINKCINEGRSLEVRNIFALTFVPSFFKKLGFKSIDRKKLPHKIWTDCIKCVLFPDCCEEAVIVKLRRS